MILNRIIEKTRERVEFLKSKAPLDELKRNKTRLFAFEKALSNNGVSFICELKKASPSKGVISKDYKYNDIAAEYESAGADAISVLTEPDFFMGSTGHLKAVKQRVGIPVLQKDFIIDEYQIYEASALGADAVLLICAVLDAVKLKYFIALAESLGMSCLVETHNMRELYAASGAGARVIGINNRDLSTFNVDINTSLDLIKHAPDNALIVSESGIKSAYDIELLAKAGVDAVLIGETLMKSDNITDTIKKLRGAVS
ncbi:MAG: indole-3-glycerol phosphate synthase TrpC [Clostridiales bacterium]|jgi:indole-3-glycerol phosphate synthase|nr:indole-3-glycerol phosphate synthase TrpC [Clostridiales bacterium]